MKLNLKRMKTVNIELNKSQFIKVINKLDEKDKLELFNELKKTLFLTRYNTLLQEIQNQDLDFDDITKEVEAVRKKRYEEGRQIV